MTAASEVALKVALVEMVRVLAALSARVQNGPETVTLAATIAAYIAADERPAAPGTDDLQEAGA